LSLNIWEASEQAKANDLQLVTEFTFHCFSWPGRAYGNICSTQSREERLQRISAATSKGPEGRISKPFNFSTLK